MGIFFGWIIFSFIIGLIGLIGTDREIGFFSAFFLSLFLSPLIGLVITLISKNKEDENYKKEVLKTQNAQKKALEKMTQKNETSIADELTKLNNLKESGLINETEFNTLRACLNL
ncbi:hypothetical protein [Tenacibaculum finnmarkense]|uniref:hypothetical protein n=1 Tax=Tenacibaculum finnmarkense TaxID=2781243 RepID=UPI000C5F9038|nr:hypothetical protein [Tenacibaculum finnmarkense]MBE7653767.1 hypothetical protein [Tenacibaculum finnmarkense genomovar finnmarkense]MCD8428280.1 hypothetical protein [Tenacibaculum finnmarkense genomovar finnmarkense]MCG8732040.1 hypothetical protein [Tenacibaculum finnmarkense]MCG8739717.1 hypothetical protein [Tenacibaculum finnmarkense]MCG8752445.1 hypothetical protein [Tenacibaculum finnmarkense]